MSQVPPPVTSCALPGLSRKVPEPVTVMRAPSRAFDEAWPPASIQPLRTLMRSQRYSWLPSPASAARGPAKVPRAPRPRAPCKMRRRSMSAIFLLLPKRRRTTLSRSRPRPAEAQGIPRWKGLDPVQRLLGFEPMIAPGRSAVILRREDGAVLASCASRDTRALFARHPQQRPALHFREPAGRLRFGPEKRRHRAGQEGQRQRDQPRVAQREERRRVVQQVDLQRGREI